MSRRIAFVAALCAALGVATIAAAGSTLDQDEAKKELMAARGRAAQCSRISGITGSGKIKITLGNSGLVTDLSMVSVPPNMDEKTDACVRAEFQKIRVTPFEGDVAVVSGMFVLM